jgi:hypothetical protein
MATTGDCNLAIDKPGDPAGPAPPRGVYPGSFVCDARGERSAAMLDPRHRFLIDFCVP